jgi:uncharacterized protein
MTMYLFLSGLLVLNALWLLLVVFGLPGTWLMVVGTILFAWWQRESHVFSLPTLICIVALALLGELVEFLAAIAGAKKTGGTRRGSLGALLGAMIGAVVGTLLIPIPVMGTLIGSCIGAGVGAWGLELLGGKAMPSSVNVGVGAGLGRLLGTVLKLVIGVIIWLIIAFAAFYP